jgi:cell division inhibitor SulA
LLPETAVKALILGGNHAQFGWYGNQEGDNQASISREAQQEQAVKACLDLLKQIESSKIT